MGFRERTSSTTGDELLELALDVLATYRLTTLVKDDKILEDVRHVVFDRFGPPSGEHAHKVSYLLHCPWCLSVYFGGLAVASRSLWPAGWRPLAKALALSALTGLLSEARQHRNDEADRLEELTAVA